MSFLKITQTRSIIGCKKNQIATIRALGLKRVSHSVKKTDSPEIRGMISVVDHLVEVEELKK